MYFFLSLLLVTAILSILTGKSLLLEAYLTGWDIFNLKPQFSRFESSKIFYSCEIKKIDVLIESRKVIPK